MNLHRLEGGGNDWDTIDPSERTPVQKLAAKTHGVIAPAHPFTLGGYAAAEIGLSHIKNKRTLRGTVYFLAGKVGDYVDGTVADKTKTKSRVGRVIDPVVDRVVAFRACRTLMDEDILPKDIGRAFLAQNGVNSAAALIATARGREINPGPAGKIRSWLEAGTLGAFGVERAISEAQQGDALYELQGVQEEIHQVGRVLGAVSLVVGAIASAEYLAIALSPENRIA